MKGFGFYSLGVLVKDKRREMNDSPSFQKPRLFLSKFGRMDHLLKEKRLKSL